MFFNQDKIAKISRETYNQANKRLLKDLLKMNHVPKAVKIKTKSKYLTDNLEKFDILRQKQK